jgi:hypothetical protein
MEAMAKGEAVEIKGFGGEWETLYIPSLSSVSEYRVKQKTIRIGDFDAPEPVRESLGVGDVYFMANIVATQLYQAASWDDNNFDNQLLKRGLVHLTAEAATLHAEALISLSAAK